MLISLYSSKGGAGKTTTILSLLSAIAEHNYNAPDQALRVLAVDADEQSTLSTVAEQRSAGSRPSHGISYVKLMLGEGAAEALTELDQQYDITVVDMPGFRDDESLKITLASDIILIPTDLGIGELRVAFEAYNNIGRLSDEHDLPVKYALLLRRVNAIGTMQPRFGKLLFSTVLESGFNVLNAKASELYAYKAQVDLSSYLFEQQADEKTAGTDRALQESRQLLNAVMNFDVLPNEPENASMLLKTLGKANDDEQ